MTSQVAALLCLSFALLAGEAGAAHGSPGEEWRIGYSVGYQVGSDFREQGLKLDPETMVQGLLDALSGAEPRISRDEMKRALVRLQAEAEAARESSRQDLMARNRTEGKNFLARNAKAEGVTALPSGLQYRVLRPGNGRKPEAAGRVTVHYRGTRIDGTEFDSTYESGEPATFRIEDAMAGWREALLLMQEGARWQLFVPPELGYGEKATGEMGPGSTLIFEIELIRLDPAD